MAESEIVERVANAIKESLSGHMRPESALVAARAAIEAMREPTEEMADDGGAYLDGFAALGDHTVVYAARGTWQTMIDHILEGPAVSTDAALSPSPAGEGR